jgi:hypothetical protein
MGYCANGSGDAIIKENVNRKELRVLLDEIIDRYCSDMEYDLNDTDMRIYFWENDTHWHEEDTMEFFDALIPYITEGCAEYTGEEDCNWRYVLKDGKWIEQNGTIYYTIEDMIKELEENGYKVTR